MKKKSRLFISLILGLTTVFYTSCDKDFNSLGSDLVGEDYMGVGKHLVNTGIQSGYFKTGAVATNGLTINNLGVFENPIVGTSEYHFATQVSLENYGLTIGDTPVIDSVYLYLPYFSTLQSAQANGQNVYTLDSIAGSGFFDLKVFESNYYMAASDPNTADGVRRYYSNDKQNFDNNIGSAILNSSSNTAQNTNFKFSNEEIYVFKRNENGELLNADNSIIAETAPFEQKVVIETFKPGMWLDLDKSYFQTKILNAAASDLANQQNFINYFRGLYFNVTKNTASAGVLGTLDFTKGYIQINYKFKDSNGDLIREKVKINLAGQSASLIENNYNMLPQNAADKLVVAGGGKGSSPTSTDGYIAYIDLFGADAGNGIPYEIDYLKNQNWLINEANVTIYVDRSAVGANANYEPQRLFLYDINNNSVIEDYLLDTSTNTTDAKRNKGIYNGILVKKDGQGLYYKFRITEYVKSLISAQTPMSDSKHKYRLGLSVTESITLGTFNYLLDNLNPLSVSQIPTASVMSSAGTVLHGANASDPEKKIKFEVYYTNPN